MTKTDVKKLNNQGFTLVELLVALAISGIVIVMIALLMTNGTTLFRNERTKIDLQNELQAVDNYVTEVGMEAKTINIENDENGQTVAFYTGERAANKDLVPVGGTAITTERIITFKPDDSGLYISKSYIENLTKGYLVSGFVTEFKVSIAENCKTFEEIKDPIDGTITVEQKGYSNPIILNVSITIEDNNKVKHKDMTLTVRNDIDKVTVDGIEYTVE